MKMKIFALAALAAGFVNAATVDRLIVRQQWPWSGQVKIEYIVSGATAPQDVSVALFDGGTPIDVSDTDKFFLTGDVYGIGNGAHTMILDADQLALSSAKDVTVKLSLADSAPNVNDAVYMIVDLVNASNVTYVTRADLKNGKYGDYETDYAKIGDGFSSPLSDVIIWTGVTNDVKYMTTHLVLRKIPVAGKVLPMGAPASYPIRHGTRDAWHQVKLTSDYWIGVFEVTQAQYDKFGALQNYFTNPDCAATRPADRAIYRTLRGTGKGLGWKAGASVATARQVDANTWMDNARKFTGLERLDLPSDAQWEIAAVAESTTHLYSGKQYDQTSPNGNTKSANFDELARYKWNDGYTNVWGNASYPVPPADCDTGRGTAKVGSYAPNAYGLYDTLGNADELVLDFLRENMAYEEVQVNPKGGTGENTADENPRRVLRGGRWDTALNGGFTLYWRAVLYDSSTNNGTGFRLCYTEHDED